VKFTVVPISSDDVQAIDKEIIIPIRDKQTGHLLGDAMGDIAIRPTHFLLALRKRASTS
jgi:hypothetical protein